MLAFSAVRATVLAAACTSKNPPAEAFPTASAIAPPAPTGTAEPAATPRVSPRTVTPTPTAVGTPVPFPVMSREEANTRRTGDPQIDRVIDALLGGDQAAVDALVGLTSIGCVQLPEDLGAPPRCAGDPEGTVVEVFPSASCEGYWILEPPYVTPVDTSATSLAAVIPVQESSATLIAFEAGGSEFRRNINNTHYVFVVDGQIVGSGGRCNTVEDLMQRATGDPLVWPVSFPDLVPPGTPTTEATPPPPRAVVTPVPFPVMTRDEANARRTGDPQIDRVIDALLGDDQSAVDAAVQLTSIGRVEELLLGGPPECESDEVEGTVLDVFPRAQCHGYWQREAPYAWPVGEYATLAAVVPAPRQNGPATLIIFEGPGEAGTHNDNTAYFYAASGRIIASGAGCGNGVLGLMDRASGDPLIWPVSFPDLVPPGTPTIEATPPPVRYPSMTAAEANARRSGVPEVDAVLDALLGSDQTAVDALTRVQEIGCVTFEGLGGPPKCDEGIRREQCIAPS